MKYRYLLFDADDTLFDFHQASLEAFAAMCRNNNIPNTPEVYQIYYDINHALWAAFDRGEVTKEYLTLERYFRFLAALGLERDAAKCNREYLDGLGSSVFPFPHAEDVCRELHRRGYILLIATNAVASVQRNRLRICPFGALFANAFISEEAGASKPDKAYYDYIFAALPDLTAENCLVIGDSLTTDILGANNAGLPCCWYNPKGKARLTDLQIDYEITDLRQLLDIL